MIEVRIPVSDVNSDEVEIAQWYVEDGAAVEAGAPLLEVETSKSLIDVEAPAQGVLRHAATVGDTVAIDAVVARLFPSAAEAAAWTPEVAAAPPSAAPADAVRATAKARARAEALGVDLESLDTSRLITERMVEAAAAPATLPTPLADASGRQRVLLIGAGRGATQVVDIFRGAERQVAVAILDDDRAKWGETIYDVPVVGGTDRLAELWAAGAFDAVTIAISTSVKARAKLRARCEAAGAPLANAIDATSKVASEVEMGLGNVICAFCQIGTSTVVGDNNFLSAYNSFDHHNVVGSDCSTGPGVVTSSRVVLGDRVRLGTGIHMEPGVELGDDVRVASGATLTQSVPAAHTVKTKIVTTRVVPNDGRRTP